MYALRVSAFLATFLLPAIGYFMLRSRASRDLAATVLDSVTVSVLFVHIVGTTLAAFKAFHPMLILLLSFATTISMFFRRATYNAYHVGRIFQRHSHIWKALLAVLALSACLRINPYNYSIGDSDPGMYIVGGKLLSRTGAVESSLPGIVGTTKNVCWREESYIPPSELPSWHSSVLHPMSPSFPDSSKGRYEGTWTSAFFVGNATSGVVYPQFLSGWMVFVALAISWFGNAAAPWMLTVFSLLSLVFIAALASRLVGKWAGVIAASLAGTDWVLAYVSKLPVSETYFGFLFLAWLWTVLRMNQSAEGRPPALISLGLVYAMMTTRLNGIYLLPILLTAPAIVTRRWQSSGKAMSYIGAMGIVFVAALVFDFQTSFEYTYAHLCYFVLGKVSTPVLLVGVSGFLLVMAAFIILSRKQSVLGFDLDKSFHRIAPFAIVIAGVIILVSIAVAFAFPGQNVIYKGVLSEWRSHEGPRLLLSMSSVSMVLAIFAFFIPKTANGRKEACFLALLFFYLWTFHSFIKQNHVPLPYGFRYYASDILPIAHILAALSLVHVWRFLGEKRIPVVHVRTGLVMIIACIAVQLAAKGHRFMMSYHAMEKTLPTLEATLEQFSKLMERPVILIDRKHPFRAMTSAFHAYGGVPVYETSLEDVSKAMSLLNVCRVILLTNESNDDLPSGIRCLSSEKGTISINEIEQHIGNRQSSYKNIPWDGTFYLHVVEQSP